MFRLNHHHQGAYYLSLLKLQLLRYTVKTHRCGWLGGVAAQRCVLTVYLNNCKFSKLK
jgi:hypothetical protein